MSVVTDANVEAFIKTYMSFAKMIVEIENAKKEKSKSIGGLASALLGTSFIKPKELLEIAEASALVTTLFSYGLKGLNAKYDSLPWDASSFAQLFTGVYGSLNLDESKEDFTQRLLHPIERLIGFTTDKIDISENILYAKIKPYALHWAEDVWPYKIIIPLHNIKSEVDNVAIGNFRLFNIETVYKDIEHKILKQALDGVHAVLIKEEDSFGSGKPDNWRTLLTELHDAVTAIRLISDDEDSFYSGSIGLSDISLIQLLPRNYIYYTSKADQPLKIPEASTGRGAWAAPGMPTILNEHIAILDRYYLDKNKILSKLSFAIRRFNIAYSRETPEDQLIDLVIALESALLPTQKDEISYRLSLRAAVLIGGGNIARTIQIIKTAYAVRSKVVHSGMPYFECIWKQIDQLKPYSIEVHGFIPALREVTRGVIVQLIEKIHAESVKTDNISKNKFLEVVCERLDERIIADIQISY